MTKREVTRTPAQRAKDWRAKYPERVKAYNKMRYQRDKDEINARVKKWRVKNQDKHRGYVNKYRNNNKGIKGIWDQAGKIEIKGMCQKCKKNKAVDRHHSDYSKPLEVELLCRKCHKDIHNNIEKPSLSSPLTKEVGK